MLDAIISFYAKVFSRPPLSRLNNVLLHAALRARGYFNYRNERESGEDFFIRKVLAPARPEVCIDIGANVGNYSEALLRNTEATVISFEPVPLSFEKLRQRSEAWGDRSIVLNQGVGEGSDRLVIHYNPDALELASFHSDADQFVDVENSERAEVEVVALDDYLRGQDLGQVDLIKIDTEGFELEVMKGAAWTIATLRPRYIQIEFNWHQMFRGNTLHDFAEMLPGYDLYQLLPGGWARRDPSHPLSNIYAYTNFIFVRGEDGS